MRTTPWRHQAEEFEASRDLEARALIWRMRTGKSKVVVDTAFHLFSEGKIGGVLVVAPNGVHANWTLREFPKHAWDDGWRGLAWSSLQSAGTRSDWSSRAKGLLGHGGLAVLSVNMEALALERCQRLIRAFLRRRVLLVYDECHHFRRCGAERTRLARGLARLAPYRRILSGTPVLNSPLHAFPQYELLEKRALGYETFTEFKRRYAKESEKKNRSGRKFWSVDSYENMEELRERIARWSSVVLTEDVADMPEVLRTDRIVRMSARQAAAYTKMKDEYLLEFDDGRLAHAIDGGARVMKLQQILGGYIIDEAGGVRSIDDHPPILDAMADEVEGTMPGKTIVWCRFKEDIRRCVKELRSRGFDPVEYHGDVPQSQRKRNEDRFREEFDANPLVGQPQAGGEGLDFSAADATVWYSQTPNAIAVAQASERATLVGKRRVTVVALRTPGTVDDGIAAVLEGRAEVSDMLAGKGLRDLLRGTRIE